MRQHIKVPIGGEQGHDIYRVEDGTVSKWCHRQGKFRTELVDDATAEVMRGKAARGEVDQLPPGWDE